mmetsp:Transcript_31456/g.82515  ORF Transcript_31456/g.82515 Transcript_31456/m.82515 type:complete len:373 (+) Transcript_31456:142-1260(+)
MPSKEDKAAAKAAKKEAKVLAKVEKKAAKEAAKAAKKQAMVDAKLAEWESRFAGGDGGAVRSAPASPPPPASAAAPSPRASTQRNLDATVAARRSVSPAQEPAQPRRATQPSQPRKSTALPTAAPADDGAARQRRTSSMVLPKSPAAPSSAMAGPRHESDPTSQVGVRHGEIRQGQIGGFTRTELPVDRAVVEAVHKAQQAAGMVAIVAIKIPAQRKAYALDWERRVEGPFDAEHVVPMLNPSEPRYYFCGGRHAPGGPVFLYACPSRSPRSDRMVYATGKKHLGETIDALAQPTLRVEITDPSDLTTQDLHGILPDAAAAPKAAHAAPKAQLFNPAEQTGSLAGLMAQTLGSTLGRPSKQIVKTPEAAHGC